MLKYSIEKERGIFMKKNIKNFLIYSSLFVTLSTATITLAGCEPNKYETATEESTLLSPIEPKIDYITYEKFITQSEKFKEILEEYSINDKEIITSIHALQYLMNINNINEDTLKELIDNNIISKNPIKNIEFAYFLIDIINNKSYQGKLIPSYELCHSNESREFSKYLMKLSTVQEEHKKILDNFYDFILNNKELQYHIDNELSIGVAPNKFSELNEGDKFILQSLSTPILENASQFKSYTSRNKEAQSILQDIHTIIELQDKQIQAIENNTVKTKK